MPISHDPLGLLPCTFDCLGQQGPIYPVDLHFEILAPVSRQGRTQKLIPKGFVHVRITSGLVPRFDLGDCQTNSGLDSGSARHRT